MRIRLIRKENMSREHLAVLEAKLFYSESLEGDCGPLKSWRAYPRYLYGFLDLASVQPIAIAEASGRPVSKPGWWIDIDFRGKGYGNELVDLLAAELLADVVTTIGSIPIQTPQGRYDTQPRMLVLRLRAHFPQTDA